MSAAAREMRYTLSGTAPDADVRDTVTPSAACRRAASKRRLACLTPLVELERALAMADRGGRIVQLLGRAAQVFLHQGDATLRIASKSSGRSASSPSYSALALFQIGSDAWCCAYDVQRRGDQRPVVAWAAGTNVVGTRLRQPPARGRT